MFQCFIHIVDDTSPVFGACEFDFVRSHFSAGFLYFLCERELIFRERPKTGVFWCNYTYIVSTYCALEPVLFNMFIIV